MIKKYKLALFAILILYSCGSATSVGNTSDTAIQADNTISSKTSGMQKKEGYFDFYYDQKEDKVYIEIDTFNVEFLYMVGLPAGVGSNDIGLDRGQLGSDHVVYFERRGPKVLLVEPNYDYRAISDNEQEIKAVTDAFAKSIHWGFKIVAEENGRVLVDATDFLIRDGHGVASSLKRSNQGSYSLDKGRSAFYMERTKNFPENSEFEVILTFKGTPQGRYIRSVTPTASAVTVRQHYSFVQLPDSNYKPRKYDPRYGFYGISYADYATPISEPLVKRYLARHRLVKKDPDAQMSEAVEPIIYYLDPGTPEPIRSALLEGASWWNQAFEAAGFKDGFQVKVLPEEADPMDVRYNVINWVHRSTRGWSYGSTVVDPRTGEIIKGHVTLGSLRVRQDFLIAEGLIAPYEDGKTVPPEMEAMALARLRQLSAHEVGHTIGLRHNYSSSMDGRASVMDYPHPMVTLNDAGEIDLSNAYDTDIGEWDKATITFGYAQFPNGSNEEEELNKIYKDVYQNQKLTFISDSDARPQGGAHPRAHLWDNGTNASDELNRVMEIRRVALNNFGDNNIREGVAYNYLEEVLVPTYFFPRYQVEAAVKIIGGLDYTYALRGDEQIPTSMIPAAEQNKALDAVLNTLNSNNLVLSESLLQKLTPRTLGLTRQRELIELRTYPAFDALGIAETSANMTLGLLLHPARASRLVEYHSRDSSLPGLGEVLDKLINSTWKVSRPDNYKGEVSRVVDMAVLNHIMSLAINSDAATQARSLSLLKIEDLNKWIGTQLSREKNENQKAHLNHAKFVITQFMNEPGDFKPMESPDPPAGSPIGSFDMFCNQSFN